MNARFVAAEVAQGVRRNPSMIVSVLLVSMVSMFFIGAGLLTQRQVGQAKGDWYDKVHAFVFLCTDSDKSVTGCSGGATTEDQTAQIRGELAKLAPLVERADYKTSEQAYGMFKQQYGDSAYAGSVEPSAMPAFFEVHLSDPRRFEEIVRGFEEMTGVAHVSNLHEVLAPFFSFLDMLGAGSAVIAIIMLLCSVMLMMTTIRQAAFTRRREVGIMRLVGATSTTIYLPFVAEVMLAALLGSLFAIAGLWATVRFGLSGVRGSGDGFVRLIGTSDVFASAFWLVLSAFLVAQLTSWVALRRYLKV